MTDEATKWYWRRPHSVLRLEYFARQICEAEDLGSLYLALYRFQRQLERDQAEDGIERDIEVELKRVGIDIHELPTFGGPEPKLTVEVWSWDADNVLAGPAPVGPVRKWDIKPR